MRILAITAGAANMYCGSCLRDNALAAEMMRLGHDVTLVPIYTPTRTDEPNVSRDEILYGGINVYLQQVVPLFRKTPRFVDRIFDSRWVMNIATRFSVSTDPQNLGELTVSTLRGEAGNQRKEVARLVEWFRSQPAADVVVLPNSMMLGLAKPLASALECPIVCTLQGEDLFLDGLPGNYREQALGLIREHAGDVDGFVAISQYYAEFMADLLDVAREKISVVPLGVGVDGLASKTNYVPSRPLRVGYLARIAPEKGLHNLCAAVRELSSSTTEAGPHATTPTSGTMPRLSLEVAGYLPPEHRAYLERLKSEAEADRIPFRYHGELPREEKAEFLRSLDIFSVPCDYREPKGLFLLEAMACGVPVVQPDHGSFPEILRQTGGGLLVKADSVPALAEGIQRFATDDDLRERTGRAGAASVRAEWTSTQMAERALSAYQSIASSAAVRSRSTRAGELV